MECNVLLLIIFKKKNKKQKKYKFLINKNQFDYEKQETRVSPLFDFYIETSSYICISDKRSPCHGTKKKKIKNKINKQKVPSYGGASIARINI